MVLRVDQTLAERKCRMALESIRNGYRPRGCRKHRRSLADAQISRGYRSRLLQMSSQKQTETAA